RDRNTERAGGFNLPLSFEANQGQTDGEVKFIARHADYTLFLTPSEAVVRLKHHPQNDVLRLRFHDANAAQVEGADNPTSHVNYFIGNDPAKWRTNVPVFGKIRYTGLYPNIDLIYYGNGADLEYDFVVGPGGDPNQIRWSVTGASKL